MGETSELDDRAILDLLVADTMSRADADLPQAKPLEVNEEIFEKCASPTEESARLFRALGDTTRLEIVAHLLEYEASAGDFSQVLELPLNMLAYHLAELMQAGAVTSQKRGRSRYYALTSRTKAILTATAQS